MNLKNEKGVALILTLGILAFLLVLALGFASSAITQKKAAGNYASAALARILASSAVDKCIAGLAFYTDNVSTAAFDVMLSHEENDPNGNNKTFDYLYRASTIQNDITYFEWNSSSYNKNDADAFHWQYVYNGASGADERIIGRYAYVVIPSGGKLNPGYCVSHQNTYQDGTARDESNLGAAESRVGKNVNEIRIGKLYSSLPGTYLTSTDVKNMSTTLAGGFLTDGSAWADTDTFISNIIGIGSETKKMYWNEWFAVNNMVDNEQFWIDSNNNKLQEAGEFYHRFNIARTDWPDNSSGATNADNINFINNYILHDPSVWAAANSDGDGIPWIKYWQENSGNWPDPATKAKQIAANLLDYCDADTDATRDNDDAPTFVGLEKCPYINEVMLKFEGVVTESDNGDGTSDYTYSITPTAYVEVCDMNSDNLAAWGNTSPTNYGNLQAIVSCEISFDWDPGPADPYTANFSITVNLNGSSPAPSGGYAIDSAIATSAITGTFTAANAQPRSITNLKITSLKVKMLDGAGSKYYDFSYIDNGSNGTYDLTTDGAYAERYISYDVDDPRQNLHYADWNAPKNGTTPTWTEKAKNTNCNPNPGGNKDSEPGASEPWEVSTAFIRNAPMQSPWELGFIHRAAKWETINLKTYNSDDDDNGTIDASEFGVKSNFGGSEYSKGDANILDQIKMHSESSIYGKFNIRAPQNVDVLRALLADIYIGSSPSSWGGGSALTYTSSTAGEVPQLANAIYGSNQRPFLTRAMVTKVSALSDASIVTSQTTDATKEEIIGKFINLTKADVADEFMILVLAQSIKDIGGGVTIYKDLNYDGDTSDSNLQGTSGDPGYFWDGSAATAPSGLPTLNETITNCQYGVYDLGADEILAEQKILVRVKYDSSKPIGERWYITRFESIEN
ncbi:MAG TPA: hypothetical protein P5270_04345 [Victivallales bacterium]|nr:hypothetical protein [Victivallales bacterium]